MVIAILTYIQVSCLKHDTAQTFIVITSGVIFSNYGLGSVQF